MKIFSLTVTAWLSLSLSTPDLAAGTITDPQA